MAGFDHKPPASAEVERPQTVARNARIGLVLFFVYLVFYGGWVLVNAFVPSVMEQAPFLGVNLAVLSGFGLIILAFVLALLYGWLCRSSAAGAREQETAE